MPDLLAPSPVTARAAPAKRGFGFGQRFFLLFALGLIWVAPMFWHRDFGYGLIAWDVLLLVACLADWLRLRRSFALVVQRRFPGPLALWEATEVQLGLTNSSALTLVAAVTDSAPSTFCIEPQTASAILSPRAESTVRYTVQPQRRGDFSFGGVYVRLQSPWRLAELWTASPLPQRVRVYPNLQDCKSQALYLTRSRTIEQQRRQVQNRGLGREFESLREFQEGDEARDICWTATARRGKVVTRLYQAERSQAVWIVIDSGRLMRARVGDISKLDHAVNAALSLTDLALHSGDRVGLCAYGRKVRNRVLPGRGRPHLRLIIDQLAQIEEETSEADHLRTAALLMRLQTRRGLIVWFTDFPETARTPDVVEAVSLLARRHLVLFAVIGQADLQTLSRQEPAAKDVAGLYRYTAATETVHRRALTLARLREQGVLAYEVESADLTPTILNSYLAVKERNQL
jgi:uncharacterized protein (DUF58 family)